MSYSAPEDQLLWYIEDDQLALITSKSVSSDNEYESIDESLVDGLMIEYSSIPQVEDVEDTPDVDSSIHPSIVSYVKWKLFEDNPATLEQAMYFERLWTLQSKKWATRKKTGGPKRLTPFKLL